MAKASKSQSVAVSAKSLAAQRDAALHELSLIRAQCEEALIDLERARAERGRLLEIVLRQAEVANTRNTEMLSFGKVVTDIAKQMLPSVLAGLKH